MKQWSWYIYRQCEYKNLLKGMVILMKITEKWKSVKKRNKILIVSGLVACLACVGAGSFFLLLNGKEEAEQVPQFSQMENGMITASGTTSTDMVTKQLEIDSLETVLYVEEVYVSSGDSVQEGDPLLKITDESLQAAEKELRQKASEAKVAYNEQKISYEESVIEARKNADITIAEGKYADSDYENDLAKENSSYAAMEEETTEAQALADEYDASVNNNYYYTYYEVQELQDEYNSSFAYLMELYEEWDIEEAENAQAKSGGSMGETGGMQQELGYDPEKYSLYQDFDKVVTKQGNALETAKEKYEEESKKAAYSLEAAQAEAQLLNAQVQEAAATLEQKKVQLEAQRDVTKAEAELAESNYEAEKKQLSEELSKAEDEYESAKEDYDTFTTMLKDGILYAQEAGEIMMINAREGQTLDVSMPYLVYSDSSSVTVTVSVDQAYIADLAVGDKATVIISEQGSYQGEITSINPVSQSTSRSSIYYSVEVTLSGDLDGVTSNLTATVMFGGENEEGNQQLPEEDIKLQGEKEQNGTGENTEGRDEKQVPSEGGNREGNSQKPTQKE